MTPHRPALRRNLSPLLFLLGLATLAACDGVETGTVSPCHGKFRAEGKYFSSQTQTDGSRVVVSTMNAPTSGCAG